MSNRILIVEDDRSARRGLVEIFGKLGLIPIEAGNVDQALARLNRETDIICLDLMLPGRNGVEVLRYVREENLAAKVAVISAANEPQMLAEVTSLRPDAIFGKPLDIRDFLEWLSSVGVGIRLPRAFAAERRRVA